jgi:carboxymethylenebutenolidase
MHTRIMAVAVVTTVAVGYAILGDGQRARMVAQAANQAVAESEVTGEHAGHAMTASEHIAHLAKAGDVHAGHAMDELAWAAARLQAAPAAVNRNLPADDLGVQQRLAGSPRKSEFVKVEVGGMPMRTWVVYPDRRDKAPVVVVIQEIFGLSDWIRGVADQLAADGFIAIAPDLLSGHGVNGGDSSSLATQQETTQATLALPAAEIMAKLKAAREYGLRLPSANGKSASVGYCFGGNQSFAFAVAEPGLSAAVVYYGTAPTDVALGARGGGAGRGGAGGPAGSGVPAPGGAPGPSGGGPAGLGAPGPGRAGAPAAAFVPSDRLANTTAPVLGLYGGADARVNASIPATETKMKELGKIYEPHVFDGAAHGFLRAQTGNEGANMKATEQAWSMTVAWLKKYTS